jgi:hypothetical protein
MVRVVAAKGLEWADIKWRIFKLPRDPKIAENFCHTYP